MATNTYTPIASITLGSNASSVEFSSIPQDYRDLVLVIEASHTTAGSNGLRMNLNSNTGSQYYSVGMAGNGSIAFTSSQTAATFLDITYLGMNASQVSLFMINLLDYSATDKDQTILSSNDAATRATQRIAGRWASSAAITAIEITPGADQISSGSTFALYGIEA